MRQFLSSPHLRFAVILGALTVTLLGLVMKAEVQRSVSVPVILASAPVDPRSLFQGDYVVLSYEIRNIADDLYDSWGKPTVGDDVYVELQPGTPVWTPVRASTHAFEAQRGNQLIRGTYSSRGTTYGIEQFFVPENQGHAIENIRRQKSDRITVRVLLSSNGKAMVDGLLIDGKEVFASAGLAP